jgi:hypothetical protein
VVKLLPTPALPRDDASVDTDALQALGLAAMPLVPSHLLGGSLVAILGARPGMRFADTPAKGRNKGFSVLHATKGNDHVIQHHPAGLGTSAGP